LTGFKVAVLDVLSRGPGLSLQMQLLGKVLMIDVLDRIRSK
jgi:hypothetical protein